MAFRCPWGHQSTNDEYCDFCGALNPIAHPLVRSSASRSGAGVAVVEQPCRVCGTGRDGEDRYCVNCGYDFEEGEPLPPEPPPETGAVRVAAVEEQPRQPSAGTDVLDPAPGAEAPSSAPALVLVVRVNTDRLEEPNAPPAPADPSDRMFMVDRSPILVGRDGPGLDIPIHGDPYVSRRHAEIVRVGSDWGVRDLGSTNGTRVNGVVVEGSEVRTLALDDVIEIGFFTRLEVRDS
jgi:hypothetical protein